MSDLRPSILKPLSNQTVAMIRQPSMKIKETTDDQTIKAGAKLFKNKCANCHTIGAQEPISNVREEKGEKVFVRKNSLNIKENRRVIAKMGFNFRESSVNRPDHEVSNADDWGENMKACLQHYTFKTSPTRTVLSNPEKVVAEERERGQLIAFMKAACA